MSQRCNKLSNYFYLLSSEDQLRYLEKLISLGGIDPYAIKQAEFCKDKSKMPKLSKDKIINYLLLQISPFTQEEMRAYKSMEAFVKVACKWIKNIDFKYIDDCCLVIGKVLHSQRLNDTPLKPWIILKNEDILYAHCTCIAGLGETCSHVASILFFLEMNSDKSVTDVLAYWTTPTNKTDQFKKVKYIDWKSPKQIVAELPTTSNKCSLNMYSEIHAMSEEEVQDMLTEIKKSGCESALMKITPPFYKQYVKEHNTRLPTPLFHIYDESYKNKSKEELMEFCNNVVFSITNEECNAVEEATRLQAKCSEWFDQRSGRITASNFKAVCRTSIENPSISLIKKICYPNKTAFKTKATVHGCEHEEMAANDYKKKQELSHQYFDMIKTGFIILEAHPYFGASPDRLISCECCGKGCLEIKCPYCIGDYTVEDVVKTRKNFCLISGSNKLDKNHAYYFQIQMQMALTETKYCDFVVWGKKNFIIDRILFDENFWINESTKAFKFFNM